MTVSLANAPMDVGSTTRRALVTYTGPAAYVTGGDPVVPANVRMGKVFAIGGVVAATVGGTTYLLRLSGPASATQTILWYVASTGVEVANGVDLSGATAQVEFIGQ
jgi:hypothetical protein